MLPVATRRRYCFNGPRFDPLTFLADNDVFSHLANQTFSLRHNNYRGSLLFLGVRSGGPDTGVRKWEVARSLKFINILSYTSNLLDIYLKVVCVLLESARVFVSNAGK